jgi:PAS domain S-box-containing protein
MEITRRWYAGVSAVLSAVLSGIVIQDIYADWILEDRPLWTTIAENIVPLLLGLSVAAVMFWTYQNRSHLYVKAVARWQLLIGAGTLFVIGPVVGLQAIQGQYKPFAIITQVTVAGVAAGSAVGYANATADESVERAQRARERSEALFEDLSAEAAEVRLTDETIRIKRMNATFKEVFDAPEPPVSLSDAVEHKADVADFVRNCITNGESDECEVTAETGQNPEYYQLRVTPFDADSAYILYTNVTDIREIQDELADTVTRLEASNERLEQYKTIINTATVGIAQTDPSDHSQFDITNDAFLDLFDAESVEAFQQIDLEELYVEPERRDEILARIDETGEVIDEEVQFQTLSGGEFYGSITAQIIGEGDDAALVAIIFDITDRVEYKHDLESSNERLEDFAYIASHDLQEPLRTASRFAELVADDYADQIDESGRESLDTVITAAERMSSMINGLLNYSRVTTRGGEFEHVDTEAIVEEVTQDLQALATDHNGTITVDSLPDVIGDRDQLWQVFQNLIKNALEHSGDEEVTITVSGTENSGEYQFRVEDDGPGIDPYIEDEIFKIFKSGENFQTESEARGIGLAIVDRIIDRHGGDIRVESEQGKGSIFVFTIAKQSNI